jgi:WD40 repeat protein
MGPRDRRRLPAHSGGGLFAGWPVAAATADGTAGPWSLATGRQLRRLDGEARMLASVAFSADGLTLLVGANNEDLRPWDFRGLRDTK